MSNQQMGGCKKRKRQRRSLELGVMRKTKHKATSKARHEKYGHGYTKASGEHGKWPTPKRKEGQTFEDEYKLYKKTGGRRGWNPNPNKRQPENPVYLASKSVFGGIKFNWLIRNARRPWK